MKKISAIVFLLSLTAFGAFGQSMGDVNASGTIDIVDALLSAQYYVGLNPQDFHAEYADVNASGTIDIVDALLIAQYYVGLIDEFPGQTPIPTAVTPVPTPITTQVPESEYDGYVLDDSPVAYWPLSPGSAQDIGGHNITGVIFGNPGSSVLPNGNPVAVFNGLDQYVEIADNPLLEISRTGILTVEAWMRPDVLNFPIAAGTGPYVHWMGKGEAGQHSWASRIYNLDSDRPNRISGYSFNLDGGLGAGSYFQDVVTAGQWIHYAFNINTHTGLTKIFKNGFLRDTDFLSDYSIVPGDGISPIRIGTRDFESFFQGAIGKVAVYDYELTEKQLLTHYNLMSGYPLDRVAGDDFDDEPAGAAPVGFTVTVPADTSIAVSNAESSSAPNSMKMTDNTTGAYARATKNFSASANPTVSMNIKTPGERVDVSILDSNFVARLYFNADGTFSYYQGGFQAVADYSTTGWNELRIAFDGARQTYDVALNGVTAASSIPYYSAAATVNTIRIDTGSAETAAGIYVDDVYVSE